MSWLFPSFLAGALAVGLPIALHLLRRWPRRPVPFPSLRFLAAGHRQIESLWQRLRRWLVLALRCAIFLLLAAAFARPFKVGQRGRANRAVVVVMDNAFALQARDRWPSLQKWARQQVGELADSDQLGVVVDSPEPHWVVPLTVDTAPALRTLGGVSPTWQAGKLEAALRLAGDALRPVHADDRQIVVLSDHRRAAWAGTDFPVPLPAGIAVKFSPLPAALPRQAALAAPDLAIRGDELRATLAVHNYTAAQTRTLRVYRDDSAAAVREVTLRLEAGERRSVMVDLPVPADQPARLRFRLDPDDLAGDDTAYAVWQPSADGALLIDSPPEGADGNYNYLGTALTVTTAMKPHWRIAAVPAASWPRQAIAVLRNDQTFTGPAAARLDEFLQQGGAALIFVGGGAAEKAWLGKHHVIVKEQASPATIGDWVMDHPLVAAFSQRRIEMLVNWRFDLAWNLTGEHLTPLAYWAPEAPAIALAKVGDGGILVCGFPADRTGGDWPITPTFVPFVHQAAGYLFAMRQAANTSGQVGQPLSLGAAPGQWRPLAGPAAGRATAKVAGSVTPSEPGIYEFTTGSDRRWFAVNLEPELGDLYPWTAGQPWLGLVSQQPASAHPGAGPRLLDADAERKGAWWWWVVAAAAVLLLTEMAVANRTAR